MTDETDRPAVSVALSTYSRAALLERLLQALSEQDVPGGFEVCVYDDASTDETPAVLARWAERLPLRIRRGEVNRGPATGRNQAWQMARAATVVFTDDDCVPAPGWLAAHAAAHGDGITTIAVGRTAPNPEQAGLEGTFSRTLRVDDARYFQTCNLSVPRALLAELGGFDETFRRAAGEDTDLGLRAVESGAEAVFVPGALVHHDVRASSVRATVRDAFRWSDITLVVRKHPQVRATLLHRRWFWKPSHPPAILAVVGLVATRRRPAAALLVLPWLRLRWRSHPPVTGRAQLVAALPALLAVDVAEVASMARGSVRHRSLLL